MGVPRATQRGAVFFEHGGQHLHAGSRHELEQLGPRIHEEIDQGQTTQQGFVLGNGTGYVRLLHGGSFCEALASGFVTTRDITSSEEPPLSIFNSYRDIPSR